jgi:hypothetical protein
MQNITKNLGGLAANWGLINIMHFLGSQVFSQGRSRPAKPQWRLPKLSQLLAKFPCNQTNKYKEFTGLEPASAQ